MKQRIGVIGCGLMGSGIAEVCARAGLDVTVLETDPDALKRGQSKIQSSLSKAAGSKRITEEERNRAESRMRFTLDFDEFSDRDIVIEAATESEPVKLEIFSRLDRAVSNPDAILASNTSSIPIMKLAMATSRPASVIGIHFFNPVPVLPLVEVVRSLLTSPETEERANSFAADALGKTVIRSKDRAGFIVNALLIPYILSAIRMLESGFASAEDIDLGMVKGCAHPMGPLALADLIGLDTTIAVAESLYEEFKEQLYAPPPLLSRMCEAGLLGRKSGRGFYSYS